MALEPSTMASQKAAMAVSTFARLGTGIAVFIIMARCLGPNQFGQIAGAMAYSGLLNLLSDVGLGTYALRLAGAEPERNVEIVRRAIMLKATATAIASLLGLVLLLIWSPDVIILKVQIMIYVAMTVASFADMSFVVVRSIGRLWIETHNVVWTSILSLVIVATVAFATKDVVATSAAFLVSRLTYTAATVISLREWLILPKSSWPRSIAEIWRMTRGAAPYAVDGALTNLSNQIDVIMITLMMDPASVGIYQAGARLVQSISPFASILSTVYLPKLSNAHHSRDRVQQKRLCKRLNVEFAFLAILGYLGFHLFGPLWTTYILGQKYESLNVLWPGFSALVGIRLISAISSIKLISVGNINWRIISILFQIPLSVVTIYCVVVTKNFEYISFSLAIVALATQYILAVKAVSEKFDVITLLLALAFIIFARTWR